jgi:hypothetical protein
MTSISIALTILLATAFLGTSDISHSAATSSMNFLAAGPSRPHAHRPLELLPLHSFTCLRRHFWTACPANTDLVAGHTMATSTSHLRAFTSTFRSALAPGSASVGAVGSSTTVTVGRLRSRVVSTFATASCRATMRCCLRRHRIPCNGSSAMRTPSGKRARIAFVCGNAHPRPPTAGSWRGIAGRPR